MTIAEALYSIVVHTPPHLCLLAKVEVDANANLTSYRDVKNQNMQDFGLIGLGLNCQHRDRSGVGLSQARIACPLASKGIL